MTASHVLVFATLASLAGSAFAAADPVPPAPPHGPPAPAPIHGLGDGALAPPPPPGPRDRVAAVPPPAPGPSIRVEREAGGAMRLDVHCGETDTTKSCADTTLAIFDRMNTPAR